MKRQFKTYPLLTPLSFLYRLTMAVRNFCYDKGVLPERSFDFPVISIGNITVGGTGKTPHVQYLIDLLGVDRNTAVLSRGYGRNTRGFLLASKDTDALEIGDEPLQISHLYPKVTVAVDEDRVHGIRLLSERGIDTVILDDAFQHRNVKPSLNILLVDWNRNILDDMVMPAGHLRESASGRRRADIIIFTKCPAGLEKSVMDRAAERIAARRDQKVFFSTFKYESLRAMKKGSEVAVNPPILVMAGIARPQPMADYMKTFSNQVELLHFPDHHSFSRSDIEKISARVKSLGPDAIIVTTEKDEARLKGMDLPEHLKKRIFILPVKVALIREQKLFDSIILEHVESFKH